MSQTSPIAKDLAGRVGPRLQAEIAERREELIGGASPMLLRTALRAGGFSTLVNSVPPLIESVADAILDEFGGLTITEIAGRLFQHQMAKGRGLHPSVQSAATTRR